MTTDFVFRIVGVIVFTFVGARLGVDIARAFDFPSSDAISFVFSLVGILFGFAGMFLQNLTEWVFRHSPLYYTFHVMLGTLMGLYFLKRRAKRAAREAMPEPLAFPSQSFVPARAPEPA